ncbi:g4008 [Coccomyxa viridis]|uniref:G4008 protein n=1 Tax=Coccomyxa viridis TaxID=1274662 RepID=A0ABP1FQR8_9CHLO
MSDGSKQKGKLPDHVVAPEGTSLFRTVNFERYVRPTPSMRLASYMGTAAFLGFFAYMAYQKDAAQKAKRVEPTPNTAY